MSKKVKISPVHLQFWCKTSVIDKIVCERKDIPFDESMALSMEANERWYFVVDKKGKYTTVPGIEFEAYFNEKDTPITLRRQAPEQELTPSAIDHINKFIQEVHQV